MAVSSANMLVAAAVWVLVPVPNFGPATDINPLGIAYSLLLEGKVSFNPQGMLDETSPPPLADRAGRLASLGC